MEGLVEGEIPMGFIEGAMAPHSQLYANAEEVGAQMANGNCVFMDYEDEYEEGQGDEDDSNEEAMPEGGEVMILHDDEDDDEEGDAEDGESSSNSR